MAKSSKLAAGTGRREKKQAGTKPGTTSASGTRMVVRHYCQGIGDCHLLGLPKSDGSMFWILIDCGVHSSVRGGRQFVEDVARDVLTVTGGRIDVLVVTHEHTDHVSGFLTAKTVFDQMRIGDVWLAWTENPEDPQAQELDRYKTHAMAALGLAGQRLAEAGLRDQRLSALGTAVDNVLDFAMGAKGDLVRASRDSAVHMASGTVRYFEPGAGPIGLAGVDGVRVFVLGPPRDAALLGLTERASEMYGTPAGGASALGAALAGGLAANAGASTADDGAPFELDVGASLSALSGAPAAEGQRPVEAAIAQFARYHYFGDAAGLQDAVRQRGGKKKPGGRHPDDQSWRRIDADWLGIAADLAMQLDARTNNTSLVLAFEFVDTGRVALFAADAQVGNWLSWQDRSWTVDGKPVNADDLLARTVYLKVGHHGSHNGTLKAKGLERMTHPDLSAFIPVKETDARNVGWKDMPYGPILDVLGRACAGRVMRADAAWVADTGQDPPFLVPSGSLRTVRREAGRWVEVDLA